MTALRESAQQKFNWFQTKDCKSASNNNNDNNNCLTAFDPGQPG